MGNRIVSALGSVLVLCVGLGGCETVEDVSLSLTLPSSLLGSNLRVELYVVPAEEGESCPADLAAAEMWRSTREATHSQSFRTDMPLTARAVGELPEERYLFLAVARELNMCTAQAYGCTAVSGGAESVQVSMDLVGGRLCEFGLMCNGDGSCVGTGNPPGDGGMNECGERMLPAPAVGEDGVCPVPLILQNRSGSCESCSSARLEWPTGVTSSLSGGSPVMFPGPDLEVGFVRDQVVVFTQVEGAGFDGGGTIGQWTFNRSLDNGQLIACTADGDCTGSGPGTGYICEDHTRLCGQGTRIYPGPGSPPGANTVAHTRVKLDAPPGAANALVGMQLTFDAGQAILVGAVDPEDGTIDDWGTGSTGWQSYVGSVETGLGVRIHSDFVFTGAAGLIGVSEDARRPAFVADNASGVPGLISSPIGRTGSAPIVPRNGMLVGAFWNEDYGPMMTELWGTRLDMLFWPTSTGLWAWPTDGGEGIGTPDDLLDDSPPSFVEIDSLEVDPATFDVAAAYFPLEDPQEQIREHLAVMPDRCGIRSVPIVCTGFGNACMAGSGFSGTGAGSAGYSFPWTGRAQALSVQSIDSAPGAGYAVAWASPGPSDSEVTYYLGFVTDAGEPAGGPRELRRSMLGPSGRVTNLSLAVSSRGPQGADFVIAAIEARGSTVGDQLVLMGTTYESCGG